MIYFIESISLILASLVFLVSFIVITINFYLIKRNGFYINVNCWFCNKWSKVLYSQRNCFYCQFCTQYNGFGKDGGYNKIIEEQHEIKMQNTSKSTTTTSNGLCRNCNKNQQLKITHLANFEPLDESNFDCEVEHFQKELEKIFKLCKVCDKVVKSTISKQNISILGSLKVLQKNGMSLLDLNNSSMGITKEEKQAFSIKLIRFLLVLFTLIIFFNAIILNIQSNSFVDLTNTNLEMPEPLKIYQEIIMNTKVVNLSTVETYLPKRSNLKFLIFVGLCLQLLLAIGDKRKSSKLSKFNQILSWIIVFILSWISFNEKYFVFVNILEIFCSVHQLYSLVCVNGVNKKHIKKTQKKNFQKLNVKNVDEFSDVSDIEEFDTKTSIHSSEISNNSFSSNTCSTSTKQSNSACDLNRFDLNKSLGSLYLGDPIPSPPISPSRMFSERIHSPILTPSKFTNTTSNYWLADGQSSSRFSSQSSGFGSQNKTEPPINHSYNDNLRKYFSSLHSPNNSVCEDGDRASFSEPMYQFGRLTPPSEFHNRYPNPLFRFKKSDNMQYFGNCNQSFYKTDEYTVRPLFGQMPICNGCHQFIFRRMPTVEKHPTNAYSPEFLLGKFPTNNSDIPLNAQFLWSTKLPVNNEFHNATFKRSTFFNLVE